MMDFFREKSRSAAFIRDIRLKNKKLRQAEDSGLEKVVELQVDVKVTEAIKNKLEKRLIPLVVAAQSEANEELPLNAIDLTEEYDANVDFYSAGNFSGSKPQVSIGSATGNPAVVKLTKIAVREREVFLVLKISCTFYQKLWSWVPSVFGDAEIVLALEPFQGELDFEEDEDEDGKAKGKEEVGDNSFLEGKGGDGEVNIFSFCDKYLDVSTTDSVDDLRRKIVEVKWDAGDLEPEEVEFVVDLGAKLENKKKGR